MLKPKFRGLDPLPIVFFLLLSACAAPVGMPTAEPNATALPPSAGQAQGSVAPTPGGRKSPDRTAVAVPPAPHVPSDQVRPSAIAGSWYPSDPDELAKMVDGFLEAVEPVDGQPIAILVPHAGYIYSGPVAASGFRQLAEGTYDVAVIISSDHQSPLSSPISVWAEGGFETPLGVAPVDVELAHALISANPLITFDPASHQGEHPIEIELPFLQRVCPSCRIVPVLMGSDGEETVEALTSALLSTLRGKRAVVIASSDLSHYPAYADARAVDGATLAAIETSDPAQVRETVDGLMKAGFSNLATCACGEGPILVAMRVARGLGADTVSVLRYANSGDAPYGDRERVVGYAAVMFWHYDLPDLTQERRDELLKLARTTIAEYLETGHISDYETGDPVLARRSGAFVTLRKGDELRGCIGHLFSDLPLYRRVQEMAVAAATSDPRFPPLTIEELEDVNIELSVLSPLRRVTDTRQIQVGTHGLVIAQAGRQGVLLPQVPVDEGWDLDEFLENLCLKAGLVQNCWAERPTLYAFTAVVFEEIE
ncbi:MAG: AmmeMemoRadiSam system protein B [Anaerolineales bacterium]|nr:MAG: AmmeMemoRadiSam system protein B [Anaerolineales bacterium]